MCEPRLFKNLQGARTLKFISNISKMDSSFFSPSVTPLKRRHFGSADVAALDPLRK